MLFTVKARGTFIIHYALIAASYALTSPLAVAIAIGACAILITWFTGPGCISLWIRW